MNCRNSGKLISSLPDKDFLKRELRAAWNDETANTVAINKKELFDKVIARAERKK